MKKSIIAIVLCSLTLSSAFAQEKPAKAEKQELKAQKKALRKEKLANQEYLCGQSPYRFNWKHETAIAAASVIYFGGGVALDFTRKPLTPAQISSLDASKINKFDRVAIGQRGNTGALISDVLLYSSFVLPATLLAMQDCRKDALVIGLMWVEVASLTLGTTEYVKSLVLRPRPYVYDPNSIYVKTNRDARYSMFSGHTSTVAAFSFFGAKVFSDYSDNNLYKGLVWGGAIVLPAVTGYLRFRSGKHFPTDIITGYLVGASIGYLVPFLHKRKPIAEGLSIVPYSGLDKETGVYMSYKF